MSSAEIAIWLGLISLGFSAIAVMVSYANWKLYNAIEDRSKPCQQARELSLIEKKYNTPDKQRTFQRGYTITLISGRIIDAMEERGVSETELAVRLNKPREYVSRVLHGEHNLKLTELSDIMWALGCETDVVVRAKR